MLGFRRDLLTKLTLTGFQAHCQPQPRLPETK